MELSWSYDGCTDRDMDTSGKGLGLACWRAEGRLRANAWIAARYASGGDFGVGSNIMPQLKRFAKIPKKTA